MGRFHVSDGAKGPLPHSLPQEANIFLRPYTPTPFNLAHKILSLTITTNRRGYWNLNSSVLNDNAYIAVVRQTSANMDKLPIRDPQKWWDTFLTSVRSKTVEYTKRKHSIENECRNRLPEDLLRLEAVPTDQLTPLQAARYAFLKEKLKTFEEKIIEGYRHRTRLLHSLCYRRFSLPLNAHALTM